MAFPDGLYIGIGVLVLAAGVLFLEVEVPEPEEPLPSVIPKKSRDENGHFVC